MIEENSLYMKDRYIVEWECGNHCRHMTFEKIEDANEFADEYEDESVILSDNGTDKDASAELIVYAMQKAVDYFNKTLPTFKLKCLKQQFLDNRENILNAYMTGVIDTFNNENK